MSDVRMTPEVEVVVAAADEVKSRLPTDRGGFTVRDRLDPFTYEQMKELMRHSI